ncbi:MAG: hypothetical protein VKI63_00815 [Cyanobium sp.]|nr:hypothetical protein [Cyanobium sp.]
MYHQSGASDSRHRGTDSARVWRWLRHPISIRTLSYWPCLRALFGVDLYERIEGALSPSASPTFAPPLGFTLTSKRYFYPGDITDLIAFHVAVVRCLPAISRVISPAADVYDLTPPLVADLASGEVGTPTVMAQYWRLLVTAVLREQFAGGVVVHADVRRCFSSLERDRLVPVLRQAGAAPEAVDLLDALMDHWQRRGCRGVPFTLASWPLVKACLQQVDHRLRSAGIHSIRMGDDYRLLCRSSADARHALDELTSALTSVGLALSCDKSWFEHSASPGDAWRRRRRIWHGLTNMGLLQPLLAESLRCPWLRPFSLPLLAWTGPPCQVMEELV